VGVLFSPEFYLFGENTMNNNQHNHSQRANSNHNNVNRNGSNRSNNKRNYGQGHNQGQGQYQGNPQQQESSYFNIHTNAMGYLNKVEMVQGSNGDFIVVNFGALEGASDKTVTTFINLTVPAKQAEGIIRTFWNDINNPQVKVFASVRIAGLSAAPFIFSEQSKTPGALGVNFSGKLINILSLKVGGNIINLDDDRQRGNARQPPVHNQAYDQELEGDQYSNYDQPVEDYEPPHAPHHAQPKPQNRQQHAPAHNPGQVPRNPAPGHNGYAPKQQGDYKQYR
jgi:Protein of unknown function (DUF3577)